MSNTVAVLLGSLAAATSMPVLWWSLAAGRPPNDAARNLRLGFADRQPSTTDLRQLALLRPAHERAGEPLIAWFVGVAGHVTPTGIARRTEQRLQKAGAASSWIAERYLAAKLAGGLLGTLVGLGLIVLHPSTGRLLLAVALGSASFLAPDFILRRRTASRQHAIRLAMPDTFDQVTICVEAGLGFEAALARVARNGDGPLAEELTRTLQDLQLGLGRAEAMRRLCDRTDVAELRHFVLAVIQAESYGIPIAQILRVQAGELREKRRQRAEETAMKIPVKVVFPLVLCILPTLFILIIGPAVVRLSGTSFGG